MCKCASEEYAKVKKVTLLMSTYIILLAGKCNFLRRLTDREDDKNKEKGNITKLITRVVPNSRNTKSTCNVVHGKKSTLTSSNWPVHFADM